MALYCIGDIQGCHDAFERLLQRVDFSASRDTLYILGDLVNRGPASDKVLRTCMAAGDSMRALLGNHDLIEQRTLEVIREAGPTGHIMNLGHGIEATTPEENAKKFVDTVRNFRW